MNHKNKYFLLFLLLFILSLGSVFLGDILPFKLSLPIPIVLAGTVSFYVVLNFIRFSQKNTGEVVILSLISFGVFLLQMTICLMLSLLTGGVSDLFNGFVISLNSLSVMFAIISSVFTPDLMKKNENVIKKHIKEESFQNIETVKNPESEINETIVFEENNSLTEPNDELISSNKNENIDQVEYLKQVKSNEQSESVQDLENAFFIEDANEVDYIDDVDGDKQDENSIKNVDNNELNMFFDNEYEFKSNQNEKEEDCINNKMPDMSSMFSSEWEFQQNEKKSQITNSDIENIDVSSMFEDDLGDLPEIKIENSKLNAKKDINLGVEEVKEENPYQFIPENIRLVDNSNEKKETKKEGKITSIGKLIVNERYIENIIEQSVDELSAGGRAKIVTAEAGNQAAVLFNKLIDTSADITNISLLDKSGYVLKSTLNDAHREQTIGAVVSQAYMTLQNYAAQIAFNSINRIIFNCQKSSLLLSLADDKIYAVDFSHNNHFIESPFDYIIKSNEVTTFDVESLKCEKDMLAIFTVNSFGNSNEEDKELEKIGAVASSIFENLRIFLINIQSDPMESVILFEKDKSLTIKRVGEKFLIMITAGNSLTQFNESTNNITSILDRGN